MLEPVPVVDVLEPAVTGGDVLETVTDKAVSKPGQAEAVLDMSGALIEVETVPAVWVGANVVDVSSPDEFVQTHVPFCRQL